MSATDKLDKAFADLRSAFEEIAEERYAQGFMDGANSMRESILKVAAIPAFSDKYAKPSEIPLLKPIGVFNVEEEEEAQPRAPRGLVGEVVGKLLREHPGLTITELEDLVAKVDDRIAPKSVGNELRRFEGKKYHRLNGREWFLIGGRAEKETAGSATNDSPAASDQSNEGDPSWNRPSLT